MRYHVSFILIFYYTLSRIIFSRNSLWMVIMEDICPSTLHKTIMEWEIQDRIVLSSLWLWTFPRELLSLSLLLCTIRSSPNNRLWGIELYIEREISPQGHCKDLNNYICRTDGWLGEEEVSWLKREMRIDRILLACKRFMNEGNELKKAG